MNGGLAATLLLCQNKGLLEMTVQKVAWVEALNKSLSAVYCIEDKVAIDNKYSHQEEHLGFTQDFKEELTGPTLISSMWTTLARSSHPRRFFGSCPTASMGRAQER